MLICLIYSVPSSFSEASTFIVSIQAITPITSIWPKWQYTGNGFYNFVANIWSLWQYIGNKYEV